MKTWFRESILLNVFCTMNKTTTGTNAVVCACNFAILQKFDFKIQNFAQKHFKVISIRSFQ